MKILIIIANFAPEIGSAAHIYFDLAKAFLNKGHEVDVITSYPREFNLCVKDRGRKFPFNETLEGINVHRCKHLAIRDNIIVRGLEHFLLPAHYFKIYRDLKKKFDICLMYIPPLPLYYLARRIKKYDGTPSILNFQDFHPQELTDVGVLRDPLMIKIMKHIERTSYKNADFITVLSNGGIEYVVKRGGNINRIQHIFNGISLSYLDEILIRKDFKIKEKIENKFLISYAGILSPFQNIDAVLDVAKLLRDHDNIIFYIVGDGMVKDHLARRIREEMIFNVKLLPLQSREEYFNIVNSSDISLILLDKRMKAPCFPGKTINLMASRQPVIAIVAEDNETAQIINEAGCGLIVNPGDIEKFRSAILQLVNNKKIRVNYGENGRKYLENNMNLENSLRKYENLFELLNYPSTASELSIFRPENESPPKCFREVTLEECNCRVDH